MRFTSLIASLFLAAPALAQDMPAPAPPWVYRNGTTSGILYWANESSACTWNTSNDVGPCINAQITAAAAAGGGTVMIPAGTFNVATAIVQSTSGVRLQGAGVGEKRDNVAPNTFQSITRLIWTGAAGATMYDEEPLGSLSLYSSDVVGIVFDCASLANICAKISQVNHSQINIGVSEPRTIGAYLTTKVMTDSPGMQDNDIWIQARSTNASYSPTGVLLDGAQGSNWNVSYNRFWNLAAWYYKGDGIVIANADNNLFSQLTTYPQPSATGTAAVFAAPGYTMPNGISTATSYTGNTNRVLHTGSAVSIQGFNVGSSITAGSNAGSANPTTVSLTTNSTTAALNGTLHFASTTGVATNMNVTCGNAGSGVPNNDAVLSTTGTTVALQYYAISAVASSQACTFSYGFTPTALVGNYTITATGASTFNLTGPGGQHNQTGISVSGGVLTFTDLVIPWTGTASVNDTWTATVLTPRYGELFEFVDRSNSIPDPLFMIGATGAAATSTNPVPQIASPTSGIVIGFSRATCQNFAPTSGLYAVTLGDCGGSGATGTNAVVIGGVGNMASSFGGAVAGGHNNTSSGVYAITMGEGNTASGAEAVASGETTTASGTYGWTGGGYSTDRGRYATNCWGSGDLAAQGDAQTCVSVLRNTIASASAVRLTADQATAGSANCINIPNNTAYTVVIDITAFDHTTVTKNESWPLWSGLLTRGANAASTAVTMATTPTPITNGTVTGSAIAVTADTTNGCLNISFTPPSANTDTWNAVARVMTVEVQ